MKRNLCLMALLVGTFIGWAGSGPNDTVARIALLADMHVNLKTNGAAVLYNQHADQAIAAVNAAKVDLVLIAGDLTDNGVDAQMDLFNQKLKQLKAPALFVAGNHDVGHAGTSDKPRTITSERVKRFSRKLGPSYFDREKAGVRVIGITSSLLGSGLPEETEQWRFLEQALASPRPEPTLLMEHHPLFLLTVDEPIIGTWNISPEPRKRLVGLLRPGGVRAVLSGHLHRPITNRLEGILFLSNGATAYGIPQGNQEAGWVLLSVPREGEVRFEFQRLD